MPEEGGGSRPRPSGPRAEASGPSPETSEPSPKAAGPPALSRLLFIADGFASGRRGQGGPQSGPEVQALAERVVRAGVAFVMLRDHAASGPLFEAEALALALRLRALRPGLRLVVNGRPDVARALGAGLHTGARGPGLAQARGLVGSGPLIGYSAHDAAEAARAAQSGADYVLASPVFATTSKPGVPPAGLCFLENVASAVAHRPRLRPPGEKPRPPAEGTRPRARVYALGGVTPERVAACRAAGAGGVAVLSALLDAPDPEAAARAFLDALGES